MPRTVLVPLDGTDKDERALSAAAALADLVDGDLVLVRVLDVAADRFSLRARTTGRADAAHARRREMEAAMAGVVDRLTAETGRTVTAQVVEGADVAGVLVERAYARAADLVVMATRAAGPLGRALRGSVADQVMRASPCPVVLVPPRADDVDGRQRRFGRVLIPLDGSGPALDVVDHVLRLMPGRRLEVILLEVVRLDVAPEWMSDPPVPHPHQTAPDVTHVRAAAEQRLKLVANRLRTAGVTTVHVRVVDGVDPAIAIALAVRQEGANFIAMSTRGMSGLERFVLGSVAEAVLQESTAPVMLVAPRA